MFDFELVIQSVTEVVPGRTRGSRFVPEETHGSRVGQVSQSSVVLSFFERRPDDPPPPCQCSEDFARKHMSQKLQNGGSGGPQQNGDNSCSTSADSSPKKPRSRTLKDIDGQEMTSSNEGSPTKAKFKTSWESPEFQKFHRLSYTIAWDCADLMGEMEDLEDGETMWQEMELGS
ncbi:hypothetical protein Bbelb_312230 [Branchiostoma belcheri]|nr:hypothetical protein Bbelb_312230 [Branchiostoma belcheri]